MPGVDHGGSGGVVLVRVDRVCGYRFTTGSFGSRFRFGSSFGWRGNGTGSGSRLDRWFCGFTREFADGCDTNGWFTPLREKRVEVPVVIEG